MSTKTNRTLTAQEFEIALPFLKISAQRIQAARLVLVDGQPVIDVATQFNCSQPAVSHSIRKVREAFEKAKALRLTGTNQPEILLPVGWEQITLIAPSSLIARFRKELLAYSENNRENHDKAIT